MVVEEYRLKTKPKIVMVSTPYRPGGLFQQIELDADSPYNKLFLHYSIGIGKIYNPEEIEKERQQFYFKREYELNYSVAIGNIFTEPEIEACEELGRLHTKFNQEQYGSKDYVNSSTQKSMGIDWGFGSSKTAFVVTEFIDEVFSTTTTAETDKKDSSLNGTQLNRSLQSVIDPEPNEEANLSSQNMRMLKTTTEHPESDRKVVTTYD
jgi:hypothetical protein